jgi:putative NADH-flavin reductase
MEVALIGASGRAGSRILAELLRRGHEVCALVRHTENVPAAKGVTARQVDANDLPALSPMLTMGY